MLEWLKTILGEAYTDDIDKKVSDEIGKNFVARADFNAKSEEVKNLNAQLGERDKQLEGLKKVDAEGLQQQIKNLQEENKRAKNTYDEQLNKIKFEHAIDAALTGAKARNTKAVSALLDRETITFKDGKLSGLDEQLKTLKKDNAYLFEEDKANDPVKGVKPLGGLTPRQNNGGGSGLGASYAQRYNSRHGAVQTNSQNNKEE